MIVRLGTSLTEKELIHGCVQQDAKAQRQLYEQYAPVMLATCCRYLKNDAEAEDAMLNGFLKIFQKIDQFKGDGSFEGWMRKIMVNEALALLRKNKTMYLEVDIEKADKEPDYHKLEMEMNANDILKILEDLPTGYRTIFNLYAIEGYNHKEIGKMLGISENTSKSQLSRARLLLQKRLIDHEHNVTSKLHRHE
ncbi:MAG: sigma-70 family RNA polymerase sigma factor [Cyclobacteriaceae bacterium]|nr:sigma-70 family RNA polymerase sigma factor [Cyclobacteriaceae bacterium]